jgi:hypothetical protein
VGETVVAPISGDMRAGLKDPYNTLTVCRIKGRMCCNGKLRDQRECVILAHVGPLEDDPRPIPRRVIEGEPIAQLIDLGRCGAGPSPIPPHVHMEWWVYDCQGKPQKKDPMSGPFSPQGPPPFGL